MKARIIIAGALLFMHLTPASLFSQSSLKGVWKGVEFHFKGTDTSYVLKEIQPCLFQFAERHYSMMYVAGIKARVPLPKETTRSNISNEQLRESISTFFANSGTYEINDTAVITHPMVGVLPRMHYENATIHYKLEKDVLWLIWKNNSGSGNLKLSRLE